MVAAAKMAKNSLRTAIFGADRGATAQRPASPPVAGSRPGPGLTR
jgi:hypothetical protein